MKNIAVIQQVEAESGAPYCTFHGIGSNGYLKLIYNGKKVLGVGTLLLMEKKIGTDGRISQFLRAVHETPIELAPLHRQRVSIKCVGVSDQKQYRFRGFLRSKKRHASCSVIEAKLASAPSPQLSEALSISAAVEKSPAAGRHSNAPKSIVSARAACAETERVTTRSRACSRTQNMEVKIAELKWIKAMIDAGIDANIKLSTIGLLAHKSRATLERDLLQNRLPPPRIRGRLRYWSLNDVNAYLAGKWQAIQGS